MERSVLSGGLDMVQLTRSVYFNRIAQLDAQQKHLSDAHISEVNCTNAAADSAAAVLVICVVR